MPDKILVQGLGSAYKEPLNSVVSDSFEIDWEVNSTYELQLTAWDDQSLAYEMLDSESSIFYGGQEFIVKQCVSDSSEGYTTVQVTATHVYLECSRIRQYNISTDTSFTPESIMAFYFGANTMGFTYEVYGTFTAQEITDDVGNGSGSDALSLIVDTWPTAVIFADNKKIQIYTADAWAKDLGNRVDYLNNTREIELTYDSTDIVNQVKVYGAEVEATDDSDDTDTTDDTESVSMADTSADEVEADTSTTDDSGDSQGDKWGYHPTPMNQGDTWGYKVTPIVPDDSSGTDTGDDTTEDDTPQYYFEPHILTNQTSVDKWGLHPGDDITVDTAQDAATADEVAKSQMVPEPALSIDVTMEGNFKPVAGEMRRLENRITGFVTNVQVVAYTWYPLSQTQDTSITLNNTSQNILDYQTNRTKKINQAVSSQQQLIKTITDTTNPTAVWTESEVAAYGGGK